MLTFSFPCSCSSFPLRGSVFFTFWIALWEVANALSIFLKLASFAFFTAWHRKLNCFSASSCVISNTDKRSRTVTGASSAICKIISSIRSLLSCCSWLCCCFFFSASFAFSWKLVLISGYSSFSFEIFASKRTTFLPHTMTPFPTSSEFSALNSVWDNS